MKNLFDCPRCKKQMELVYEYSELNDDIYFINDHVECPICHKRYCITERFTSEGFTRKAE